MLRVLFTQHAKWAAQVVWPNLVSLLCGGGKKKKHLSFVFDNNRKLESSKMQRHGDNAKQAITTLFIYTDYTKWVLLSRLINSVSKFSFE